MICVLHGAKTANLNVEDLNALNIFEFCGNLQAFLQNSVDANDFRRHANNAI